MRKLASEVIHGQLDMRNGTSVDLGRFLTLLMDEGQEAYAPQISVKSAKNNGDGSTSVMVSNGAAVFRDDHLVGWLSDSEWMALLWLRNEKKDGDLMVRIPDQREGGYVGGELRGVNSKLSALKQGDSITMNVQLTALFNVSENTSKLDLDSADERSFISDLLEADIKDRIDNLCKKVQKKFQSDIFGFGLNIYKQDPKVWKSTYANEWGGLFPNVKVVISVDTKVVQSGLLGKGANREDIK